MFNLHKFFSCMTWMSCKSP